VHDFQNKTRAFQTSQSSVVSFPGLLVVVGEQKGSGVASYSIALRSHDEPKITHLVQYFGGK